jgi:hypothetical protein
MGEFLKNRTYDGFLGVNLRDEPTGLEPGDLLQGENVYPVADGKLAGRGGQSLYNTTSYGADRIRSLYRFYKQDGTRKTIVAFSTAIFTADDVTGDLALMENVYTADRKFSFITWSAKDKAYWINGAEALRSYDGTTLTTIGAAPIGSQVELHDNRLWILQDNAVPFSDLNVDNSWPGANSLNISDSKGGKGKFLKSFGRGLLIAGKDTGLWRFEGSPILGGQLTRYSDIGCIAAWSADVTPFGIPFLSHDGIWLTDGFQVTPISGKLDPLFSGTGRFADAVGKYYKRRRQYFFSFNTSLSVNDQLWVATSLETSQGQKIGWTKYTGFKAESFMEWDGPGDVGQMFYGRADTGEIRWMDVGALDIDQPYTCKLQILNDDYGDDTRMKQPRFIFPLWEGVQPCHYAISYNFGSPLVSGTLARSTQDEPEWGEGAVVWGAGDVHWLNRGPMNSEVSSCLNFKWGAHVSFIFENPGDGALFKFHEVTIKAKVKEATHRTLFAIDS